MQNFKIVTYPFNDDGKSYSLSEKKSKDWPVVYLIHNNKEMYVGETNNFFNRFGQHLNSEKRKELETIKVIFDDEYNKSAILDIEQSLIQYFNADQKYKLQNLNGGQSQKHNYYQREKYLNKLDDIWKKLSKEGLTNNPIETLRNSDLFKFSPYNTLTEEQNVVCYDIMYDMMDKLENHQDGTSIVEGGAGTGKTILLINMISKLVNALEFGIDFTEEDDELSEGMQLIHDLKQFCKKNGKPKIGYVVPMTSIRKTIKKVFSKTKGLSADMVIGPCDVIKDDYDILFVDEAHRLCQYKNIGFSARYKEVAKYCGLNYLENTQLDFIVQRSKYRVLVYDKNQTVKGSDITNEQFKKALNNSIVTTHKLLSQMRCKGGKLYTNYIDDIFDCKQQSYLEMNDYDFKLYDNVNDMILNIRKLDKNYGLCRNAAGYSWKWISQGLKSYEEVILNHKEDIEIDGYKYVWNMTNQEFIISGNAVNEIGCIHTLQGYDLNYIGLIFGREIDYNPKTNRIEVDLSKFYDTNVKRDNDLETVRQFIINSYKVMMTRGIKGCYVYACNENLRNYLKKFIKVKQ